MRRLGPAIFWFMLAAPALAAGPADAVARVLEDARALPPDECRQTRWLWQPDSQDGDEETLSLHVNLLSRSPVLRRLRVVSEGLYAVALDVYELDPKVWEKLLDVPEVYFSLTTEDIAEREVIETKHWPGGTWRVQDGGDGKFYAAGDYQTRRRIKDKLVKRTAAYDHPGAKDLQRLTGSYVPIVRADWFFQQSCRQVSLRNRDNGVGYYNWIGIKNRGDFLTLIGLDRKLNDAQRRRVQDIVDFSGVSTFPRFIVGERALEGEAFHSLDEDTLDLANLPTEFLKPGVFKHKAEEWFGIGLNRLPKFLLADAAGVLQPSAPDFIGPDDSPLRTGRDGKIHVLESCLNCHFGRPGDGGMRPVDGWVRRVYRRELALSIAGRAEALEFERLYLSDMNARLANYRRVVREALQELLGPEAEWHTTVAAYAEYRDRYRQPVDLRRLAAEIGMRPEDLLAKLRERSRVQGGVPASLGAWLRDGGTVRREVVEDFHSVIALNVLGTK